MLRPPVSRLHNHSSTGARTPPARAPVPRFARMRTIVAALALGMAGSMASAAADGSDPPEPLETFQRSEDRLFRVGYRLATANAAFCDQTVRVSGLLIHDAGSYSDPAAVRRQFGLLGDIGVRALQGYSQVPLTCLGTQKGSPLAHQWMSKEIFYACFSAFCSSCRGVRT